MGDEDQVQNELDVLSVGERLRLAREAKGMSLDDVAGRTRIPIRHLQNIENEEWDALPAVTYAIGFSRNYANALGLDGAEIAGQLRNQIGGGQRRTAAADYYEPADPARVPPRSLALVAALLAALLIGGYLIWRSTLEEEQAAAPVAGETTQPAPATPAAPPRPAPQAVQGRQVTLTALGEVWLRVSEGEDGPTLFMGSLNSGQTYAVPATATRPVIRTGRPQMLRASAGTTDLGLLGSEERTIDNVSLLPQDLAARARAAPPAAAPAPDAPLSTPPAF